MAEGDEWSATLPQQDGEYAWRYRTSRFLHHGTSYVREALAPCLGWLCADGRYRCVWGSRPCNVAGETVEWRRITPEELEDPARMLELRGNQRK